MKCSALVAVAANGVIGKDGLLPWHFPDDLRRFRQLTEGNLVLMGRKTYQSLPLASRPLPNRITLLASRQGISGLPPEVLLWHDLESKLSQLLKQEEHRIKDDLPHETSSIQRKRKAVAKAPEKEKTLWIVGGSEIFKLTQPWWDSIELTRIPLRPAGDTYFDATLLKGFQLKCSQEGPDNLVFESYQRSTTRPTSG